jgi:ABC-2 type transport system ATP-binding protein
MKQRLCLAKTLVHDPQVLLLDEPASGLDPHARIEIRELIKELCRMGKTVLVSSHILTELSDFCTSVGIIEAGRMLACGRVEYIKRQLAGAVMLAITVAGDATDAAARLSRRQDIASVTVTGSRLQAEYVGGADTVDQVLTYLVEEGVRVSEFRKAEANLEDIFLRVTKGQIA